MLSFIVPAYNEELELPETIAAIRRAAQDRQHEIIVVDDASTDATAEIAKTSGARLISINRRQIAAARNTGGHQARGDVLFFVDADTRINHRHVDLALAALTAGYSGGSARIAVDGTIPLWASIWLKAFCLLYFAASFGVGAFLFTTRKNYEAVGGLDEQYFAGEEVIFTQQLKKLGRFKILPEPVLTSGRKLRMYSAREILGNTFSVILRGPRAARSRDGLHIWYDGKRETSPPMGRTRPAARSTSQQ